MIKNATIFTLLSATVTPAFGQSFESFQDETHILAETFSCPGKISKDSGLPDLWACILPGAEVLKLFVNEEEPDSVSNVKLMWNDWTRDTGYGVHTDEKIAEAWAAAIAARYAPEQVQEVLEAFKSNEDTVIANERFNISYTYFEGPAIDERLLTITDAD